MTLEEEIFLKARLKEKTLLPFGFVKKENNYIYTRYIKNNTFRIDVLIDENKDIRVKVYDEEFNDEYTYFRVDTASGDFVASIKEEIISLLHEIKKQCYTSSYYLYDQTTRIVEYITKAYGTGEEHLFDQYPSFVVFRNSRNEKWYAIIMNIAYKKLDKETKEDKEVEIINVKVSSSSLSSLLNKKGIFKAYHMNKKNWISIVLDSSLDDWDIIDLINKSYDLVDDKY